MTVDFAALERAEHRRAQDRASHARNKEARNARRRARRAADRDRVRADARAYYQAHAAEIQRSRREELARLPLAERALIKAKQAALGRKWYLENKERHRAATRAWHDAHREEVNARRQEIKKDNRQRAADDSALRRARQRTAGPVERIRRQDVWARDGGRCHICLAPADVKNWHLDHVLPIAVGGTHALANVAVSHPSCNQSKGGRVR